MKKSLALASFLFAASSNGVGQSFGDEGDYVREVAIAYVAPNLIINADPGVGCDEFNEVFADKIDSLTIPVTSPLIDSVKSFLSTATVAPVGYESVDTRYRIHVRYRSGRVDELCFAHTGILSWNCKIMLIDRLALFAFIDRMPDWKKALAEKNIPGGNR